MSESSEKLRAVSADGWPVEKIPELKLILDEHAALTAENLEWLRIARGYIDADVDSRESYQWLGLLEAMRRGRAAIHTPTPIVETLRDELAALQESHSRLKAIYEERGRAIAELRRVLDATS